jgi:nucleotide-binding universal stress UspA family protein
MDLLKSIENSKEKVIEKILVPVDQTEEAQKIITYAAYLARNCGNKITILHVYHDSSAFRGREYLLKIEKALDQTGLNFETLLEQGDPAQKILDISKREKYDLILMGRRQTGIIREFLMGSVSYKVTHHATCPVLIVE